MDSICIRAMEPDDWEAVKRIYESGIDTGIATFETTSPTWEYWDKKHLPFARLVAQFPNKITGWAALSLVSNRQVYRGVAELSIYIDESYRGRGIGKFLMKNLIEESERNGIWTLQAGIFPENAASIKLHKQAGFRVIGLREKIGKLKGSWKDNLLLEKRSKIVGIN